MKNKKNIFLIIITCLFLGVAITLHADSGWDGDYDSGSSWGSGGSSWDWGSRDDDYNWGSHTNGNKSDSPEDLLTALIIVGGFFGICIIITIILLNAKGKNTQNGTNNIDYNIGYDINKIKEIIPDFNTSEFRAKTFEIYKNIQIAWMNFDYDTLQKHTTNELYNLYKSELIALKTKKQKNMMENISLLNFKITDIEKGNEEISIKVKMNVMCKDYVIDKNNKVVRGDKTRSVIYEYEMTFTSGINKKDNKCPNCNAPLENNVTSTCPYCNSIVISNNYDWVLSKKQVINQKK